MSNDPKESKSNRRKRLARERYATVSPGKRVMINKRRRDVAATKRIFKTPKEIKEKAKQTKSDYKKRMKDQVTTKRGSKSNVQTTCILTPSPWQALTLN
jgi:hypothetical protein